jgi:hypothetical protein
MKARVGSIITPYKQKKRSALATFLSIDLIFRLIELQTEEFLLIWKDNNTYRQMPEAVYENCPPSGVVGMIYCFYLAIEFGAGIASEDQKPKKIEEMHRGAQYLFMPTIRPFLENWTKRNDKEYRRDVYPSRGALIYENKIPLQSGEVARYDSNPDADNVTYNFMFKHLVAQDFIEQYYYLGSLNQRCKTSCLPFSDRLTDSFASNIITETMSNSDPILLDTFVESYTQLEGYTHRPFDRLQKLARSCKKGVNDLEKLFEEGFDEEWKLDEIRKLARDDILQDVVTLKAKSSGYSLPPVFFQYKKNPALCAVNELCMRLRLREAVAELEGYCPVIRYAFHIFTMIQLFHKTKLAWPDMGHVVNQFGHRTIFGMDSLPSDLRRLGRCVTHLRNANENPKNLHGFSAIPGSTELMKVLGKVITKEDPSALRDLKGRLLPGIIAKKEKERKHRAEEEKARQAEEERKRKKEEERPKSPPEATATKDAATKSSGEAPLAKAPARKGRGRRRASKSSRSKQKAKPSPHDPNTVLSTISENVESKTGEAGPAHDPSHVEYIDALIHSIEVEELDWHFNYLNLYLLALKIVLKAVSRYFELAAHVKYTEPVEVGLRTDCVFELINKVATDEKLRAKFCPVLKRDIEGILAGVERKCLDDAEEAMEKKN